MQIPPVQTLAPEVIATHLFHLRDICPLVHVLTNEVVQEITADVLLAAGASPAMVVAPEEQAEFAAAAGALLVNMGTPTAERVESMRLAIAGARAHGVPWVLDPVAAGAISWRTRIIRRFLELGPSAVRGNASEILACADMGKGGKGVDSTDSSDAALPAAVELARRAKTIVAVTGATDYVTDGQTVYGIRGGSRKATLVVGTGCSLSALLAAFLVKSEHPLEAAAACCAFVKRAQEQAAGIGSGPGSFRSAYLDALFLIEPKDFY